MSAEKPGMTPEARAERCVKSFGELEKLVGHRVSCAQPIYPDEYRRRGLPVPSELHRLYGTLLAHHHKEYDAYLLDSPAARVIIHKGNFVEQQVRRED